MKALSIRQPWAWLIVNGFKDIENRTWKTKHRGEFLIHASQYRGKDEWKEWREFIYNKFSIDLGKLPSLAGGIVGKAEITDCVQESNSVWFDGPNGFLLKNAQVLPYHPCKGQLSFFNMEMPSFNDK